MKHCLMFYVKYFTPVNVTVLEICITAQQVTFLIHPLYILKDKR